MRLDCHTSVAIMHTIHVSKLSRQQKIARYLNGLSTHICVMKTP